MITNSVLKTTFDRQVYIYVKSVIKYYTRQNTPVFSCFLDAFKDFDRVNHW